MEMTFLNRSFFLFCKTMKYFDLYGQRDSRLAAPVASKGQSQVNGLRTGSTHIGTVTLSTSEQPAVGEAGGGSPQGDFPSALRGVVQRLLDGLIACRVEGERNHSPLKPWTLMAIPVHHAERRQRERAFL